MTFFVEKRLALGAIRFGVSPRREAKSIDTDPQLSTGAEGEFIRRRGEGFFFGGNDRSAVPSLPATPSIRSTAFWTSLKQHAGLLAHGVLGEIFVLLGVAVLAKKGPAGWVEVILGLGMIAVPIVKTAQERKAILEQEERERAEREATEKRNREMLAAYTAALDRLNADRSDESIRQLESVHPDLPYEIWSAAALRTLLVIAFDELAKRGSGRSAEVAQWMDRASRAAGLTAEDQSGIKLDFFRTIVWHLLADDRMGPVQQEELRTIRSGFGIADTEEDKTIDEFQRLGGLSPKKLPRVQCTTQLAFQEYCVHQSQAGDALLHVTSRRIVLEGRKKQEYPLSSLSDPTVLADENTLTLRAVDAKKPLHLKVDDPIFTAGMIDLAGSIDERPKGFA
jgi:heme exporter protein D